MIYRAIETANARRIALVGIAKHAGKTTAMNELIESAAASGRRLGVVSIGVDGERNDAIMGVPKPEVFVPVGTLVASAGDVLTTGSASLRVLESTGLSSTLGDVYLAEVTQAGTVLLAGIRYAAQVEQVLARMEALGADLCLVDGAFDRMMAASPALTDGVVLATGAVVATTVEDVARQSAYFLQRFALPVATEDVGRLYDLAVEKGALVVGVEEETGDGLLPVVLVQTSSFTANPQTDPKWPGTPQAKLLAVTGAVTDRLLNMLESLPRGFTLVLADATHFFVSQQMWRKFLRRGHQIVVRRAVQVFGVTVNPHSVAGYRLPRRELLEAVRAVAGDVPVEDVKWQEREV
ncbi:MAG: lysine 5,6-aminomutase reactivase subunit KamB [Tumebacillaceae bacterium]